MVDGQADTANLLIENGILSDNVYVAATSIKKIAALEEYEASLSSNYPESYWQKWFSENKWLLGSDFAQILDERYIDVENIADYIMKAFDGFVDAFSCAYRSYRVIPVLVVHLAGLPEHGQNIERQVFF